MPYERNSEGETVYTYVPADCLALLPFAPDPVARWKPGNDLDRFQHRLAQGEMAREYCLQLEDVEEEEAHSWAKGFHRLADAFTEGSTQAYHPKRQGPSRKINYRQHPAFGGFAKTWAAWQMIEEEVLSENGFASLVHTLESRDDIGCALELLQKFYYRQAFVSLRLFIEDVIYPPLLPPSPGRISPVAEGSEAAQYAR